MLCSRKLYKGNSYEICLPITDSGVTVVRFYTRADIVVEKEPIITSGSMCFDLSVEDLDVLEDGVLRYEVVTESGSYDTNSPYVVKTPEDYDAKTLEEYLEESYESGYTDGQATCEDCEDAYESGYTSGVTDGYESGYTSGSTDGYQSGYTEGSTDGYSDGYADGYADGQIGCVHDYSEDYFTIEALEDGVLTVRGTAEWQYYTGPGEIEAWHPLQRDDQITISAGDRISFKASSARRLFSGNTLSFNVFGNIESLEYGDDFASATSVNTNEAFYRIFCGCTGLVSAENLILPATSLTENCYNRMFQGCTSLTTAPELPATTLAVQCYLHMLENCTSLNYIKCLATDISANNCTLSWVDNVAATGTFVKNPNMSSWTIGIDGIPSGWTIQNACDCNCDDAYADGYTSGSTDGYNSGYTEGYADGVATCDDCSDAYSSGFTSGYTAGFNDGELDGYDEGYQSGSAAGYQSGYTDGVATCDDCSGAYNSGYTQGEADGYQTGYEDGSQSGYSSGYTDGAASVHLQSKNLGSYSANGTYNYAPDSGYSGISGGTVTVNIPPDIWTGTQVQYDALQTYDNNVLYIIIN